MSQPQSKKQLSLAQHLGLSCASSGIAETITLPIDTIKVHIQSHPEQKLKVRDSVRQIWQAQGATGFSKAWFPSISRQVSYTGVRLGLFGYLKNQYPEQSFIQKMALGGTCGLIGNLTAMPFDVLKTRVQGQSSLPANERLGVMGLTNDIYKKKGFSGFYRGLNQTAQRSVVISGIQLPIYFTMQEKLAEHPTFQNNLTLRTTTASFATTCIVTSTVYPIDLCKSLVMNSEDKSTSTLKEASKLVKSQGPSALYRGWSMGLMRALPHFLLTATCYEQFKNLVDA